MEPLSTIKFQVGIPTIGPPGPIGPTGNAAPPELIPGPSWIAGDGILSYLNTNDLMIGSNVVFSIFRQGPFTISYPSALFLNANVNFYANDPSYVMTIGRSIDPIPFTGAPNANNTVNIVDNTYLTSNILSTSNTNILASAIGPFDGSLQPISLSCQFIDNVPSAGTFYYNIFIGNSGSTNFLLYPYGQLSVLKVT